MRRFYSILVISFLAMALAGCQPRSKPQYPEITFDNLPPIQLDVAEIVINNPYQEPLELPHVGEQFPVSPSRAARRWVEDRLRAVGSTGQAVVTIVESGAVEQELERTSGVTGLLTKDQAQSYEIAIEMTIEADASTEGGQRKSSATMRVTKKTSVAEDATMNEREATWYKLTQNAMNNFNEAMEKQIGKTMSGFMK